MIRRPDAWTKLSSAPFFFPYYPHVFLLPDGRLCVPADAEAPIVSEVLDLKTSLGRRSAGPRSTEEHGDVFPQVLEVGHER